MIFQIYGESKGYYYIHYFKNFLDTNPVKLKKSKWDFEKWKYGKIEKPSKGISQIPAVEKDILEQLQKLLKGKKYILEKDAIAKINGHSKKKIKEVVKKKRVRVNKKIKEELGIIGKGYPFILLRNKFK